MNRKTFIAAFCAFLALAGCSVLQDDAGFARSVMNFLINGRYIVRPLIEWKTLNVLEFDIAPTYAKYKTDTERADYERYFISSFSDSYKKSGSTIKTFYNWRLSRPAKDGIAIVTANCGSKDIVFYFYIRHKGWDKKLIAIRAEDLRVKTEKVPDVFSGQK